MITPSEKKMCLFLGGMVNYKMEIYLLPNYNILINNNFYVKDNYMDLEI